MPKKIKTRKQKLQSDLRKQTPEVSYTLPVSQRATTVEKSPPSQVLASPTIATRVDDYHYLKIDLWKTLLFSIAVVMLELVLRFFVIKS